MDQDRITFVTAAVDQLKAAIRDRDGDGAAAALQELYGREPEIAEEVMERLTITGLENLTGLGGGQ